MAADWFNYGQFLRRHGQPAPLSYACFLKAQALLQDTPGQQLDTVRQALAEMEAGMGAQAAAVRRHPEEFRQRALAISDADLAARP